MEAIENIEINLNDLAYESSYQFALAVRMQCDNMQSLLCTIPDLVHVPTKLALHFENIFKAEKMDQKEIFSTAQPALQRATSSVGGA